MFRKLRESPYFKAGITIVIGGIILILFHNWVSETRFSVGFETLNKTFAPVYLGVIFAFILCPVYNVCVKAIYRHLLSRAGKDVSYIGGSGMRDAASAVDKGTKRTIFNRARILATVVCVLLVVGLVGLLIYFVVPQVVASCISLVNTLPERLASLSTWLSVHFEHFPILSKWVDNIAHAGIQDIVAWIQTHILDGDALSIANMISSGVFTAFKGVLNAVIGLLIMIYLLNYKERLFAIARKFVASTCGQKRQQALYEFADIVNETFIAFIVGRVIDSFIIGVLTGIVLKIFGIPFALMISVIVGVTNVIPFFGPFIGAIPSTFILMLEDPMQALYFVIIIVIIQQLDGNVIGPKIVGNAIGISSFWVLIAVLVGGGLFGFTGMALGVPVFAVFYRYADKFMVNRLKHRNKATNTTDYFSLEQYGLDTDEIDLEPDGKNQETIFDKLKKSGEKLMNKDEDSSEKHVDPQMQELIDHEKPVGQPKHRAPKVPAHFYEESDDYQE